MRRLKKRFVKELRALIDSEIQKEREQKGREEKIEKYNKKMEVIEADKKILPTIIHEKDPITKLATLSRNSSVKGLKTAASAVGAAPVVISDDQTSMDRFSMSTLSIGSMAV